MQLQSASMFDIPMRTVLKWHILLSSAVQCCLVCTYLSPITLPHMAASWSRLTATRMTRTTCTCPKWPNACELNSCSYALCVAFVNSKRCHTATGFWIGGWWYVVSRLSRTFEDTSQRTIVRCSKNPPIHHWGNGRLRTSKIWAEVVVQLSWRFSSGTWWTHVDTCMIMT